MSARRTLQTRADGRASNKFAGTKKKPPAKTQEMADVSDLESLSYEELRTALKREALLKMGQTMRNPTRHAQTVASIARDLASFVVEKPVAKIETDNTTKLQGEITINLIPAKDGRRAE